MIPLRMACGENTILEIFFGNIWNNILDVEVNVNHSFVDIPVVLNLGLQGIFDSTRSFEPEKRIMGAYSYNPGRILSWGEWESNFSVNAKVGVSIFY